MDLTDITRSMVRSKEPVALKQLDTPWTSKALEAGCPKSEYPRPQFKRDSYMSLNGIWGFCVTKSCALPRKKEISGRIRVPFSPESALSIVDETSHNKETLLPHVLKPDEYLWYYKKVEVANRPSKNAHLWLHFGAVDQICDVYINSHAVAHHEGGYLPFTIDVTSYLKKEPENETTEFFDIKVCVKDVTDTSWLSRGKQTLRRGGMFYSAQSGIWQSVWMEWVPETVIYKVVVEPQSDLSSALIKLTVSNPCDVILRRLPDVDNNKSYSDKAAFSETQKTEDAKDKCACEADRKLFGKIVERDLFKPCDPLEAQTDHGIPSSDTIPLDVRYAYTAQPIDAA